MKPSVPSKKRRAERMCVVEREQMCRALAGAAGAGIGEVLEAVVRRTGSAPLVRILGTQQILLAETVIDLDVVLVVGSVASARRRPVVVDGAASAMLPRVRETAASFSGPPDRSGFQTAGAADRECRQFGIPGAGVRGDVVVRNEGAAYGARSIVLRPADTFRCRDPRSVPATPSTCRCYRTFRR